MFRNTVFKLLSMRSIFQLQVWHFSLLNSTSFCSGFLQDNLRTFWISKGLGVSFRNLPVQNDICPYNQALTGLNIMSITIWRFGKQSLNAREILEDSIHRYIGSHSIQNVRLPQMLHSVLLSPSKSILSFLICYEEMMFKRSVEN